MMSDSYFMSANQEEYSKLADWDDDDPSTLPDVSSKWDKLVILKHMFTLKELEVSILLPLRPIPFVEPCLRRTQLPFWTSRKMSEMNALSWEKSRM
jgi:hypothetical protein